MPPHKRDSNDDDKSKAVTRVWAVRRCDSLNSPALFTDWDDCSFYVDVSENDANMEYQSFESIVSAVEYLFPWLKQQSTNLASRRYSNIVAGATPLLPYGYAAPTLQPPPPPMAAVAQYIPILPQKRPGEEHPSQQQQRPPAKKSKTFTTAAEGSEEVVAASPQQKANTMWEDKFALLKEFKERFGDCQIHKSRITDSEKFKRLDDWVRRERNRILEYQEDPSKTTKRDAVKVQRLLEFGHFPMIPQREKVQYRPRQKFLQKWETRYQQLVEFKAKYKTLEMSKKSEGYDEALYRWIVYQKEQLYREEQETDSTTLGQEKVKRLTKDLGLVSKKRSCSWVPMSLQKEYLNKVQNETDGTDNTKVSSIPSSGNNANTTTTDGGVSIKKAGDQSIRQTVFATPAAELGSTAEQDETSTPTTTTAALADSGLPSDQQQDLPISPSDAEKAVEDKNAAARPTSVNMTAAAKQETRRLKRRSGGVREKIWDEKFLRLKEYKEEHGTCDVVKFFADPELYRWVCYERERIKKLRQLQKEHPEQVKKSDEERAEKLMELGFVMVQGAEAKREGRARQDWGTRKAALWEAKFEMLRQYKEIHGTCEVSRKGDASSEGLERWVAYQALQLRNFEEDPETSNLDTTRASRLKELGVRVRQRKEEPTIVRFRSKAAPSWDEMFEELKVFSTEHGHCEVPQKPKSVLRNWTLLVRDHYNAMGQGKDSHLNPERMVKLTNIGFRFQTKKRMTFDQRAVEWLEYKTREGKDAPRDSGALGTWISKTRAKYALLKEGKPTSITQEQADKLTSWGFIWDLGLKKPVSVAPRKTWEERYSQLARFHEENGHCDVPQAYPELGTWVHHQRRDYRHMKKGAKSYMNKEKMEKLAGIGFKWITRKSPTRPKRDGEAAVLALSDNDAKDNGSSTEEDIEETSNNYNDQRSRNPVVPSPSDQRNESAPWERYKF